MRSDFKLQEGNRQLQKTTGTKLKQNKTDVKLKQKKTGLKNWTTQNISHLVIPHLQKPLSTHLEISHPPVDEYHSIPFIAKRASLAGEIAGKQTLETLDLVNRHLQ